MARFPDLRSQRAIDAETFRRWLHHSYFLVTCWSATILGALATVAALAALAAGGR